MTRRRWVALLLLAAGVATAALAHERTPGVLSTGTLTASAQVQLPSGASTAITCASGTEGSVFWDTNAGALGTADDGRLCVCNDNVANGYRWRAVGDLTAGVPVDLTGNSTTDCGT